ncbi:OmpA family protein [Vibrio europaeus]|uniref:OmpA family protein n=1 Tax=Vibrio europaeus TaxID=300876 RepID=A0AAE7AUY2_9VIBR|nr:OmpA family protein [Vibrio europaeus]MDC5807472.1 OmpA family protein [Vibrio europaeus]MDC5810753.1 OmpA family protein [Vibrio europaeus]MDC5824728.1 OmpA family protein [Vibrio europaeus]MDC5829150.1 OmpA family protein [Vibrio europaeus]MDC5836477.1 OmpA family protein [Vibrio europaeus]
MNKLAAVISASLLVASAPTMAEVYLGGKVGKSWLDDACTSATANCDDEASAVGVFAGYQMWDFLSIEGGYDYLGEFTADGLNDEKVEAFTLAPKVNLPMTDGISLYGKLGGAYVKYGNQDDYSYLGAAGIEFDSGENVAVRVEYQTLTDINNNQVRAMGNTATLGFVYKFGASEQTAEPVAVVQEEMIEVVVEEQPAQPVIVKKIYESQVIGTESFTLNSTELNQESVAKLDELVDFLNDYPQARVEVTGYTDTSGRAEYNQKVSEKRAAAVESALVDKGIDDTRITVEGKGESNPIASNETREGRAQNRRVEIVVPAFEYQIEQ